MITPIEEVISNLEAEIPLFYIDWIPSSPTSHILFRSGNMLGVIVSDETSAHFDYYDNHRQRTVYQKKYPQEGGRTTYTEYSPIRDDVAIAEQQLIAQLDTLFDRFTDYLRNEANSLRKFKMSS